MRQGHTELAVGLARIGGQTPVVIGAEMLQPDGDHALPVDDGMRADRHGIPFLTGSDLIEALETGRPNDAHTCARCRSVRSSPCGPSALSQQARALGDHLTVVVAHDDTVRQRKHEPVTPWTSDDGWSMA